MREQESGRQIGGIGKCLGGESGIGVNEGDITDSDIEGWDD